METDEREDEEIHDETAEDGGELKAALDHASVRGGQGVISISRKRGTVSAGVRDVPLRSIAAIEVSGGREQSPYEVAVDAGSHGRVELTSTERFGPARACAVAFARVAGVPIRDLTLGAPAERRWEEWEQPLVERLRLAPVAAPGGPSPGEDLAGAMAGDELTVRMTPGSIGRTLKRMWRDGGSAMPKSVLGWLLLPVAAVFLLVLLPIVAVLAVMLAVAVSRGSIALVVSPRGVRQRGFVSGAIPAAEVRDVEIEWASRPDGSLRPDELVIRSDRKRISFHGSSEAELQWLRASVLAALAPPPAA